MVIKQRKRVHSERKKMRIQKYPDTCRWGLNVSHYQQQSTVAPSTYGMTLAGLKSFTTIRIIALEVQTNNAGCNRTHLHKHILFLKGKLFLTDLIFLYKLSVVPVHLHHGGSIRIR